MSTFSTESDVSRSPRRGRQASGDAFDDFTWTEPEKPARDWKKLFLVAGLGVLSWVATYVGMLELIEANMGELPLVHKAIIGFSVAMLMTMIIWLLDQLFAPIGFFTKVIYAAGYVFLSVISIGFGFGFYWKVLESRSEASRSAEGAVGQVQGSLFAASTRLDQLQSSLDTLTGISKTKAQQETATGTSCPNSKPGDGPRRKLREDDAARFQFASEFVKGRAGQVKAELKSLDVEFARITSGDKSIIDKDGTRNEFMKALSRRLDNTVTGFNAFRTDPQLKQIRQDLAERGEKSAFPDSRGGTFQCPDPQISGAIKGVVRAIDELPAVEKPKIAAVEGSEATIEAFRRLQATMFGVLSLKLPPTADELRELQKKAVQSAEGPGAAAAQRAAAADQATGLSKRDYVPLAIAVFVDLCLLLVSMGRPMNRMHSLVPKMREAERGPVYQILSRFTDIHKDEETREKFELFRHVVFDFNGDYYVAVPLDAPYRYTQKNAPRVEKLHAEHVRELQLEASMLANLFASFEKEKIFTRIYNPMLSTKAIQKRLARQGSKFAHSQAFRVYRFKDGAWSDIILGAVMGAAKRVEAEKRRRRAEEDLFAGAPGYQPELTGGPTLRSTRDAYRDSELPGGLAGLHHPSHDADGDGRTAYPEFDSRPAATLDPDLAARFGPYARHVPSPGPARDRDGPLRGSSLDAARAAARTPRMADFEADVNVQAANSNTAASRHPSADGSRGAPSRGTPRREPPANVIPLPTGRTMPPPHRLAEPGNVPPRDVSPGDGHEPTKPTGSMHPGIAGATAAGFSGASATALAVAEPSWPSQKVFEAGTNAPAVREHEDIVRAPAVAAAEPMVEVTLVERRATYSIPSSEAVLPPSVLEQLSGRPATGSLTHDTAAALPTPEEVMAKLGEALAASDDEGENFSTIDEPAEDHDEPVTIDVDPREMARVAARFAPGAKRDSG